MRCLNTDQMKRLLIPGTDADIPASIKHVSECERCSAELRKLAAHAPASIQFSQLVLGIAECPDYEALSAFVDEDCETESAKAIAAHINLCDMCARDVEQTKTLRSHAALRGSVDVAGPVPEHYLPVWGTLLRRAAAGAALAAAAVALYFVIVPGIHPKAPAPTVAVAPPTEPQVQSSAPRASEPRQATASEVKPPAAAVQKPAVKPQTQPSYKVVLVDGQYTLAKQGARTLVLKNGAALPVSAGLVARMAQKVATGKLPVSHPVALAMNTIRVRDSESYVPPPTAPRLIEPVGRIVLSDKPELKWSSVELARGYRVTISDAQGNVVYDEVALSSSHSVTARLERGRVYTWQVGVRFNDNDGWTLSRAARFKVLSSDDLAYVQGVSRSMPGSHLALGVAYESVGLADEAAREYRLLKHANPGRPF